MLYNKIRVDFKYGPKDRFYRILLVREDIDLFSFCVGLGVILGAEFEHCFLITIPNSDRLEYVMAQFMEEMNGISQTRYLRNYTLCVLPDKFDFEYDTGEGWDFKCKKYKNSINRPFAGDFILLDGKGLGIWEDNISSLYALFDGDVDPNSSESNEEEGYYLPWNLDMEKYGDFDNSLNIDEINESLNEMILEAKDILVNQEINYVKAYDIDTNY